MAPEQWLVLTVHVPAETLRDALVEELIELGGTAVEEEQDRLITYVPAPEDPEAFVREARERLQRLTTEHTLELSWDCRPNEDWAETWRRGLRPRRVGRRLIVAPTWTDPDAGADDVVLWIDPQMAFGTGEHPSTRGVLRLLEASVRAGDRALDVGTGSGILAIALAKLGADRVLAVESDPDAVANARENLERNGVDDRVELVEHTVDDAYLAALGDGRFDLILANILSGVLVPLLPAFARSLRRRADRTPGRVILGGILTREADRVVEAARRAGFDVAATDIEDEWWSALLEARAAAGPEARSPA
ncbi:MAG TPA: 50S ribosomal protein L11 methyltransferase [Longimicrobiales bacterium]